jgi:hypothetical protein
VDLKHTAGSFEAGGTNGINSINQIIKQWTAEHVIERKRERGNTMVHSSLVPKNYGWCKIGQGTRENEHTHNGCGMIVGLHIVAGNGLAKGVAA